MNKLNLCSGALQQGRGTCNLLPKKQSFHLVILLLLGLTGCGPGYEQKQRNEALAEAFHLKNQPVPVTDSINGNTYNFVRQASLRCKVKDVKNSAIQIEALVAKAGGYVSKSDLASKILYNTTVKTKKDSMLELTHYQVISNMELKIPSRALDTFIRKVTGMAQFIDQLSTSAKDVKLQLMANNLAEARLRNFSHNLSGIPANHKPSARRPVAVVAAALESEMKADNLQNDSYGLSEQVNYSSVQLEIYQNEEVLSTMLPIVDAPQAYEPDFLTKIGEGFINGFEGLKIVLLFLVNSWGPMLLLALLIIAIKKMISQNKRVKVP